MTAALRLTGLLLLIVVTLLPGWVSPTSTRAASARSSSTASVATVKVAMLPYISFAPFYIAQDEGFFAQQGLKVELVNIADQVSIIPALVSGQVDVSSGLVSAGILNTIKQSGTIKIVADKGYIDPTACDTFALVAGRGLVQAGIAQHPQRLRGARANISRATWLEYYAEKALNKVGLKVSDLKLVNIPVPAMDGALTHGQIDLVAENEPWVTRFEQNGNEPVLTRPHRLLPNSEAAVTLFGSNLLGKNAGVGKRFMVAYLRAVRQYNAGKTARNITILAKNIKLDPALLKRMCWPTLRGNGRINVASIVDFQRWAVTAKYMDKPATPAQFWDSRFVDYAGKKLGATAR